MKKIVNELIIYGGKGMSKKLNGEFLMLPMDKVIYGENSIEKLPELLKSYEIKRPYIITISPLADETPLIERLKSIVGEVAGVYSETKAHVPKKMVLEIADEMRNTNADGVISLGGGSPVDAAKIVTLILTEDIHTLDELNSYLWKYDYETGDLKIKSLENKPLPHIAIPTTLSAAEFTHIAGVTDEVTKVKAGAVDPILTPTAVILDPVLTLYTPEWLWLSTGLRAVDHAVESICSNSHTPYTDALAKEALQLLNTYLPKCKEDPNDLDARVHCQVGAWLSISGLANVNLGLSHGIGHQLGGRCGVPHGVTSCVMLPTVMEYNLDATEDRQAIIAKVIGAAKADETDKAASVKAAPAIRDFIKALDLPWRLRDTVVEKSDFDGIAKDALEDFIVATNPKKIKGRQDVIDILEKAW